MYTNTKITHIRAYPLNEVNTLCLPTQRKNPPARRVFNMHDNLLVIDWANHVTWSLEDASGVTAVRERQTAVTAYFSSKQLLLFALHGTTVHLTSWPVVILTLHIPSLSDYRCVIHSDGRGWTRLIYVRSHTYTNLLNSVNHCSPVIEKNTIYI